MQPFPLGLATALNVDLSINFTILAPLKKITRQKPHLSLLLLSISLLLSSCAAQPETVSTNSNPISEINPPADTSSALTSTYISYSQNNFYSLITPNASECAGDAKTYYDTLELDTGNRSQLPKPLGTSPTDPGSTIRPSFIKNISVDITNSNSLITANQSSACSFGVSSTSPPPSTCATFDYDLSNGASSTPEGKFILFGGMQDINLTGIIPSPSPTGFSSQGLTVSCGVISVSSSNSTSTLSNKCYASSFYGFGANILPISAIPLGLTPGIDPENTTINEPISMWYNFYDSVQLNTGPSAGLAGAAAAFNSTVNQLVIFGGSAPAIPTFSNSTGFPPPGSNTFDTWLYDFNLEKWSKAGSFNVPSSITLAADVEGTTINRITKAEGPRALFGYLAAPGMAFSQLAISSDSDAAITSPRTSGGGQGAQVDLTDRLLILGGRSIAGQSYCNDDGMCPELHRFNPTFGPELIDNSRSINPISAPPSGPVQWLDSYHTTLLTNMINASPTPSPSFSSFPQTLSAHYAKFPVLDSKPFAPPLSFASAILTNNNSDLRTSYIMAVGGFYGYPGDSGKFIQNNTTCPSNKSCGALALNLRRRRDTSGFSPSTETAPSNFLGLANTESGVRITPTEWLQVQESTTQLTPWFGGGIAIKGLDLLLSAAANPLPTPAPYPAVSNSTMNQVAYFGGSTCRDYLLSNILCSNWPNPGNEGRYWVFGVDPAHTMANGGYPVHLPWGSPISNPSITTLPPLPPINAGMSAARGLDPNGNPIIVAWGGVKQPGTPDDPHFIYYLAQKTTTTNGITTTSPSWGVYAVPDIGNSADTTRPPRAYVNSAMVFSHVTRKFYIFGGVDLENGPMTSKSETWELSFKPGTSEDCGLGTEVCQFRWRKLELWDQNGTTAGLTCYPFCPPARRSHRMVEINYNNTTAPAEPNCDNSSTPCSFGIFMQGGTPDGTETSATGSGLTNNTAADRWMFDPTANAGFGHWQLVTAMAPRALAAMSSVNYYASASQLHMHRAVLFGGETAMENPNQAADGFFVPPTLGDTWIYDYTSGAWSRAKLYGSRYSSIPASLASEADRRAATLMTDPSSRILSPPPLAGAMMVTRTLTKPNHKTSDPPKALKIPEIFLFGGRDKRGFYHTIDSVYKFCIGTTGEKPFGSPFLSSPSSIPGPNDGSCDAFDLTENPFSTSPVTEPVGRWLFKTPQAVGTGTPALSLVGSYLGAATYDSGRDLIILFGGLSNSTSPASQGVTQSTNRIASSDLYEYTPPSQYTPPTPTSDPSTLQSRNGTWRKIPSCSESTNNTENTPGPLGRYAHNLAYDANRQQLILIGGYDSTGALLKQTINPGLGASYSQPDSWTGTRIDGALPRGIPDLGVPTIAETNNTFPCYYWKPITTVGNKIDDRNNPPINSGLAHAVGFFFPSSGYNTGYYTLFDRNCVNQGVISNNDPAINKLLVGGSYIDIDRTQLDPQENVILNVTFIPFSTKNTRPNHTLYSQEESAILNVHLIRTGESAETLKQALQPRNLTYAYEETFPKIVDTLSVLAPPTGEIQQAQVLIPLSIDPRIDRIKIERYSGSAILIDAAIHRLNSPKN